MSSPNNPKSSAQLIREHSTARVLSASNKRFIAGHSPLGLPQFSRRMTGADAVAAQVKKYR